MSKQTLNDILGRFGPITRATANAGTVITVGVPPWRGAFGAANYLYQCPGSPPRPNWMTLAGRTVITSCLYTTGGTAHTITLLRPLNWARITTAVAKNATTGFICADDPGVYSTNYKYPCPISTGTAVVADNAIAANDFVAYQLTDGTWMFDKVASGTYGALVMTTGTPNVTGGGVPANSPLFFFGITTDKDPSTGLAHPATITTASTDRTNLMADDFLGFGNSHWPGAPLLLHSANAAAAGSFEGVSGYYAKN